MIRFQNITSSNKTKLKKVTKFINQHGQKNLKIKLKIYQNDGLNIAIPFKYKPKTS